MSRRRIAFASVLVVLGIAAAFLLGVAATGFGVPVATSGNLLIRNARIVDARSPEPTAADLLIREGRVIAIAAPGAAVSPGGEELDVGGRFVAPGLIDLHAHMMRAGFCSGDEGVSWENVRQIPMNFDVALAYGNTTVVDLGGPLAAVVAVRDLLVDEGTLAPRYLAAGPILTAPDGYPLDWADREMALGLDVVVELIDVAAARREVARLADAGVDLIKMASMEIAYNERPLPVLADEVFAAAVEAAHARGLRVFVHAHTNAGYRAALRAGADVIAHSSFERLPDALVDAVVKAGVIVVPTLWAFSSFEHVREHPELLGELRLQILPGVFERLEDFTARMRASPDELPPDFLPGLRRARIVEATANARDNLRRLVDAGAIIGYGSDTSFCYALHGSAAHELSEMARAGMGSSRAFAAATLGSAQAIGRSDLGVIEEGAAADLVVLDANPFQDVGTLRAPAFVVRAGNVVHARPPAPPGFLRTTKALSVLMRALYF